MRRLTPSEKETLATRYLSGESSGKIARSLGVSDVAILNHLHRQGVVIRAPSEARRVYPIRDEAFSPPLKADAAYWVGFLMADGCVLDESKIQVALAAKDLEHLEALREFWGTASRPIYNVRSNGSCHLKVHSRKMVTDLARFGVVPRKSLTAKALGGIEGSPAFWLGVFDGDGSVGLSKNRCRVRMFGTQALMGQFIEFLEKARIRGRSSKYTVSGHATQGGVEVSLHGKRAENFLDLMYGSCPVCLQRKKVRAEEILGLHFSGPES